MSFQLEFSAVNKSVTAKYLNSYINNLQFLLILSIKIEFSSDARDEYIFQNLSDP